MKTPKEYIENLKNRTITTEMLADCLYSVNKRAKNYRDAGYAYRYSDIGVFQYSKMADFYNYKEQFNLDNNKLNELKSILDKLVIYKANTETFAKKIIINTHSGLSTYILSDRTPKILLDEYKKYSWYNLLNTN